ncbi:hypothetical protein Y032_0627g814 [Ancylostoma ceylanicum]|uniref:Protein kinase domain-containing protein n=1 Tax=Ancylostoma ceylanicum TaxID=53326 RepID=A0A016WKI3_9BILA|nr:hypothetical protein Y032_0627g814 [Ancylostoma ceylanicum]
MTTIRLYPNSLTFTRAMAAAGVAEAASKTPSKLEEKDQAKGAEQIEAKPIQKKLKKKKKPKKEIPREKMEPGQKVASDSYTWRVIKILGSGGFGDVYKVVKEESDDKKEYAMKTEMVEGDKLKLRLKIEVLVLGLCHDAKDPKRREHFVEFVDRGKTRKFKVGSKDSISPVHALLTMKQ